MAEKSVSAADIDREAGGITGGEKPMKVRPLFDPKMAVNITERRQDRDADADKGQKSLRSRRSACEERLHQLAVGLHPIATIGPMAYLIYK